MKKFVIERNLPGAGNLTQEELRAMSQTSNEAVTEVGNSYQWVQSFVTGDKLFCVHIAESEADVREHAKKGGFPINSICEVKNIIDPLTPNTKG